ncbi:hypothetical protein TRFO_29048 [Tritrichomonas foetus]|uniref:Uncharacterized protein n=1 Tax=Tritrichomonas foetus TaxID=1144522 RepID=A0A1J4JXZ2_9EUKA|nr:hypothetical protein TRFO_29048 [Tritrichomonas foetus]|eukprot:OHT03554.1 hypothetical protein TRFO_29048 [Tritrichomonas foetus]
MSVSSSSYTRKRDVKLPEKYFDINNYTTLNAYRDLLSYILKEDICPLPSEIADDLNPKPWVTVQYQKATKNYIDHFKAKPRYFTQYPNFTIIYGVSLASALGSANKDESNALWDYTNQILSSLKILPDEKLLDIFIPAAIGKVYNDDSFQTQFINILVEKYSITTFFPHYITFLQSVVETKKINRYHISIVTKIVTTYSIDSHDLEALKGVIDSLKMESFPGVQSQVKLLKQALMEFESEQFNYQSSFSPRENSQLMKRSPARSVSSRHSFLSGASSFAAPSARSISPEILEEILENAESGTFESSTGILNEARAQLERLKEFPRNRSFEPLFNLALETYKKRDTTDEEKKHIYLLMTSLNTLCNPIELLNIYLKNQNNKKYQGDFLEQCYQHFLKTSGVSEIVSKTTKLPVSLVVQSELAPRKDIEFAFTCLNYWESSYDGVRRVWELIKNEPEIDINEYFDPLDFTQKCFLITGLRAHMMDDNLESLEPVIEKLDSRMMNETKSARVAREAQIVGEKMSELIKTETPKMRNYRSPAGSSRSSSRQTPSRLDSSHSSRYGDYSKYETGSRFGNLKHLDGTKFDSSSRVSSSAYKSDLLKDLPSDRSSRITPRKFSLANQDKSDFMMKTPNSRVLSKPPSSSSKASVNVALSRNTVTAEVRAKVLARTANAKTPVRQTHV